MAEGKSLEQTPTWAVAVVSSVTIIVSLLLDRGLYLLGKKLKRSGHSKLFHTLEEIKNELMVLGFISLTLVPFRPRVASICISEHVAHRMLPCPYEPVTPAPAVQGRRRLFATQATSTSVCKSPGYEPMISVDALDELHIFIFVLAIVHVLYSCLTVLVGLLQVKSWEKWEVEAREDGARVADDLALRKKHHNPLDHASKQAHGDFFKFHFLHTSTTGLNLDAYVYCFFRQFGKTIFKKDYLALRFGFIGAHHLSHTYDFHSYIRRTMESDFKHVVGISAYLWAFVCIFLLLNINGWHTYLWIAFIPTILVLIVGAKLQHIIIHLAIEVRGGLKKADHPGSAVQVPPMNPRDDLFWFSRPRLLLKLIHFILFQNAFELAFFFWAVFAYGFNSCLLGKKWMIIVRLGIGVFVQILCSASTLPLYALVSQMGSTLKDTVFKEEMARAIRKWHEKATQRTKCSKPKHHPCLCGIMGFNKEKGADGHVRDSELLPHEMHGNGHGHPHSQHPHDHLHHADTCNVEIWQEPLVITQESHDNNESKAPVKPSAVSNITKLALEKECEKSQEPQNDIP